jgi:N-acetylneuraminic acid mutarotase
MRKLILPAIAILFLASCEPWDLERKDYVIDLENLDVSTVSSLSCGAVSITTSTSLAPQAYLTINPTLVDEDYTYGICWSASNAQPTITDSVVFGTEPLQYFPQGSTNWKWFSIKGLSPETEYYVRSFFAIQDTVIYGNVNQEKTRKIWNEKPPFPGNARQKFGNIYSILPITPGTNIYLGGGVDTGAVNNRHLDFWEFNPCTEEWFQRSDVPDFTSVGVGFNYAFSLGNKGYFLATETNILAEYHFGQNVWKRKNDFPGNSRLQPSGFYADSSFFYGFGSNTFNGTSGKLNDLWKYNPASDSWDSLALFPGGPRDCPVAFGNNGNGYVGSEYLGLSNSDLWTFTPSSNSWQPSQGTLPFNFYQTSWAVQYLGKIYILADKVEGLELWVYDPDNHLWSEIADGPFDEDHQGGFMIANNSGIFIGAGKGNIALTEVWQYFPE